MEWKTTPKTDTHAPRPAPPPSRSCRGRKTRPPPTRGAPPRVDTPVGGGTCGSKWREWMSAWMDGWMDTPVGGYACGKWSEVVEGMDGWMDG